MSTRECVTHARSIASEFTNGKLECSQLSRDSYWKRFIGGRLTNPNREFCSCAVWQYREKRKRKVQTASTTNPKRELRDPPMRSEA